MATTVGDDYPEQQRRGRVLLVGMMQAQNWAAAMAVERVLSRADYAQASGDIVRILRAYQDLVDLVRAWTELSGPDWDWVVVDELERWRTHTTTTINSLTEGQCPAIATGHPDPQCHWRCGLTADHDGADTVNVDAHRWPVLLPDHAQVILPS